MPVPKKKRVKDVLTELDEGRRYQSLIKALTPKGPAHKQYVHSCTNFIVELEILLKARPEIQKLVPIRKLDLIKSELFSREYLVAQVDGDWFKKQAPGCGALASPELRMGPLCSPPIAMVPSKKGQRKSEGALSILEHEFVHVNQAILNRFPGDINFKTSPLSAILETTLAEYEANFVQLYCWPKLFAEPKMLGFSLHGWCILRGFTQAIEKFVLILFDDALPESVPLEPFLNKARKHLPLEFQKFGLGRDVGIEYAERLPQILAIASTQFIKTGRYPKQDSQNYLCLEKWIRTNLLKAIQVASDE